MRERRQQVRGPAAGVEAVRECRVFTFQNSLPPPAGLRQPPVPPPPPLEPLNDESNDAAAARLLLLRIPHPTALALASYDVNSW